jgi:hypothetical protein
MCDKIRELEELGLVYKNTGAEWASPPLILPKPGPDRYRMTVDLRVPNASTKPTSWPMPNLKMICTTCMAQKYLRRWIFVKVIGRFLCTKILKTVSLSSRRMECTHRHVYYMELGTLRSICSLCSSSRWTTSRATSKYGWMTVYFIRRRKMTCSELSIFFSSNVRSMDSSCTPASACCLQPQCGIVEG